MKNYQKIHIWEFPPNKTFVFIKDNFRKRLFSDLKKDKTYQEIAEILNEKSVAYREQTLFNGGHIWFWNAGYKKDRGRKTNINIPLWALIEIAKLLSSDYRKFLVKLEKNIKLYTSRGRGKSIKNPKLPVLLTPETISIIFNLCGDGHIGQGEDYSSYRQTNKEALNCFIKKLENTFGGFEISVFEDSKLVIPKIITDFYQYYFNLNTLEWDVARIPDKIKNMPKDFLIAGLASFIIDEGHISDTIEIYSKNKELSLDIKEILSRLGYKTYGPREKYKNGKLDSYRTYIALENAQKLFNDILEVSKKFPTCALAHKMVLLERIVKRQNRSYTKTSNGFTKTKVLELIESGPKTIDELSAFLNIGRSSVRQHVDELLKQQKIRKNYSKGKRYMLISKN